MKKQKEAGFGPFLRKVLSKFHPLVTVTRANPVLPTTHCSRRDGIDSIAREH